ncbi:MAG: adenylosuccinate lyase [Acidimicrobiia bacterium]|nr:adenylosuccinate lyase [Acidimicrobiia bacterium]
MTVPNILAERYASREMVGIFDPANRIRLERRFWLAVLRAQADLGVGVPDSAIADYEAVVEDVDLASINRRDRLLKHDVKARIEEFNELAGHQEIHKGLTSRDLTENVEQLMTWQALELIDHRTVSLLRLVAERASEYAGLAMVGRTHNVPAQPTTLGKRFAQAGEELLLAHRELRDLRASYPIRGIKGPVGSQQDQLDLLGSVEKVEKLEELVAGHLGIDHRFNAVGQVYPRSLDFAAVSTLLRLAAGPSSLAMTIRLMAGHNLVTEGFKRGQVGSSAMPHKMNARSCERINGLYTILQGHVTMASSLAGHQWNEGDVACSVVRRVVVPDSFFTIDGLYETTFDVVRNAGAYPEVIDNELRQYLPFLATTKLLVHAVRHGMGREDAHEVIKEHAVATALSMREGEGDGSRLIDRLAVDERFPGSNSELWAMIGKPAELLGTIEKQVGVFCDQVETLSSEYAEPWYRGAEIL